MNQFMRMQMNLANMINPYVAPANYNRNYNNFQVDDYSGMSINNAALQMSNYCMCDLSSILPSTPMVQESRPNFNLQNGPQKPSPEQATPVCNDPDSKLSKSDMNLELLKQPLPHHRPPRLAILQKLFRVMPRWIERDASQLRLPMHLQPRGQRGETE